MIKFKYHLLLIFFISTCLPAQQLSKQDVVFIDSLYKTALSLEQGYQWMQQICAIGPRLSGSENSAQSLRWAEQQLRQITGPQVYLQPATVPTWNRGNTEQAFLLNGPAKRALRIAALGGSIATPSHGITAGVVEVSSFKELEAKSALVNGKIVFFNPHFTKTNLNTFSSYGELAGIRVFGAREAAKYGAVATLLRSITSRNDNVPHVGVMIYADSIKKIPSAALGIQDADYLHETLLTDSAATVQMELDCAPGEDRLSANVIAEWKGSEKPDEIILMSGHFDSWDKGQGAQDDAAGIVHTMESLSLLARAGFHPRHTIRFVLFMNEENGSRGASAYADSSARRNEKHLAAIESDRGGFVPQGFGFEGDSIAFTVMNRVFPELQRWNLWYFKQGGGGADISRIKNCRIKLGFIPDSQRYFDFHHSDNDVLDAVNPRELELGSAANATIIYLLDKLF